MPSLYWSCTQSRIASQSAPTLGHGRQLLSPGSGVKVPAAHGEQEAALAVAENVRTSHGKHAPAAVPPTAGATLDPGGQPLDVLLHTAHSSKAPEMAARSDMPRQTTLELVPRVSKPVANVAQVLTSNCPLELSLPASQPATVFRQQQPAADRGSKVCAPFETARARHRTRGARRANFERRKLRRKPRRKSGGRCGVCVSSRARLSICSTTTLRRACLHPECVCAALPCRRRANS